MARGFQNRGYTGVGRTAFGVSVAGAPDGPWVKLTIGPVFESTQDPNKFDSYRVDDSCYLVREGKIWMYYKGRQWEHTPQETKMGVAIGERPEGPFVRQNNGDFVQDSGHEVMVWPYKGGVMSMVSDTGPNAMTLQFAADGVSFQIIGRLPENYPRAPGCYRPDLTDPEADGTTWGICMATDSGHPYLQRYTIRLAPK